MATLKPPDYLLEQPCKIFQVLLVPTHHVTGKGDVSGNYLTCNWGERQRANTSFRGNDVGWLVISALFGVLLRPNTGMLLQELMALRHVLHPRPGFCCRNL